MIIPSYLKSLLLCLLLLCSTLQALAIKYIFLHPNGTPPTNFPYPIEYTTTSLTSANTYVNNNLAVNGSLTEDLTIYVQGGTYEDGNLDWTATSPTYTLKIINYQGEKAVFNGLQSDGKIKAKFFSISNKGARTNVWVEGLTVKNYSNGIRFGVGTHSNNCSWLPALTNSHNTVKNNIFLQIGNKFSSFYSGGYSVLSLQNSHHNLIENNVFYKTENDKVSSTGTVTFPLIHVIYMAHFSQNNIIKDNYIGLCTGDPLRVRDGCNNNTIIGNYIELSGNGSFVQEWHKTNLCPTTCCYEEGSYNTLIQDNVMTFPHPEGAGPNVIWESKDNLNTYVDGGGNFVIGTDPDCEKIVDLATGDINNDGVDELFMAVDYSDFTLLKRSKPNLGQYLSKVLYKTKFAEIGPIEVNDFDGDGDQEVLMALNDFNTTDYSRVYKGDALNSAINQGYIFQHTTDPVVAITSGDYDGNGSIEVLTATNVLASDNNGYNTEIHKGDGVTSLSNLGQLFTHNCWTTAAMTSGDYNNDGSDDVLFALNAPGPSLDLTSIVFKHTGDVSNSNLEILYLTDEWKTADLTTGDFNGNGSDEVFLALDQPTTVGGDLIRMIKGDGMGTLDNIGQVYTNTSWTRLQIAGGPLVNIGDDALSTAISKSNAAQLFVGHGNNSISSYGQFYKSYFTTALNCPATGGSWTLTQNCCFEDITVNHSPIPGGLYQAGQYLSSNSTVQLDSIVDFRAGTRVELNDGFEAEEGATFTVEIQICP